MTISAIPDTPPVRPFAKPTALYRYFDADDTLLYIGIAQDLAHRENGHIKSSVWMQLTARSTIERFPDRPEALAAEREAIETEHPIFNIQYNDSPEARDRRNAYIGQSPIAEIIAESRRRADARNALAVPLEQSPKQAPQEPPQRPEPARGRSAMSIHLSATDGLPIIMTIDDGDDSIQLYLDDGIARAVSGSLAWMAEISGRPIPRRTTPDYAANFDIWPPRRRTAGDRTEG